MQCAGRLRLCAARTPAAATRRLARARQSARVVSSAAEGGAVANGAERIRRDGQGPFGIGTQGVEKVTTPSGSPRLHCVFYTPKIHWNTGNIGRTCLGFGAQLHLIEPLGFSLDEKQVRRAGLDYWESVNPTIYKDWDDFLEHGPQGQRLLFTKYGSESLLDVDFAAIPPEENIVLVFGNEECGLTDIKERIQDERLCGLPMLNTDIFRSFNLSTSASIALWEAYSQITRQARVPDGAK